MLAVPWLGLSHRPRSSEAQGCQTHIPTDIFHARSLHQDGIYRSFSKSNLDTSQKQAGEKHGSLAKAVHFSSFERGIEELINLPAPG